MLYIFRDIPTKDILFLCGKFNGDILKHDSHLGTKHFVDTLHSLGLYPLINKPTRITRYTATFINNIFTNAMNKGTTNDILLCDITDHFPMFALCEYGVIKIY